MIKENEKQSCKGVMNANISYLFIRDEFLLRNPFIWRRFQQVLSHARTPFNRPPLTSIQFFRMLSIFAAKKSDYPKTHKNCQQKKEYKKQNISKVKFKLFYLIVYVSSVLPLIFFTILYKYKGWQLCTAHKYLLLYPF